MPILRSNWPLLLGYSLCLSLLSGCGNTLSRLEQVGKAPSIAQVSNPMQQPNYRPVSWPTPSEPPAARNANSLWQPGARTFFRDQRARRVGDILKVVVNVQDKADINNKTERSRDNQESLGVPQLFGIQNKIGAFLPGKTNPESLIDMTGKNKNNGTGVIARQEAITTQVAAIVTQILPNGNLVIRGKQEIRVNYELREVTVEGIIRPEDISADNSITSDQIAEAHISYGGRGQLSDVQQPRVGSQVLDILSPF